MSTVAVPPPRVAPVPVVRPVPVPVRPRPSKRALAKAYLSLTKPRIIELLLVTTLPAMVLAAGGVPSLGLVAAVLVGGALAAGAANALNCYLDRDIDQVMRRTARRPLPAHTLTPRSVLVFGLVLGVLAVAVMAVFTNPLATLLTIAAIAYYDVVYTMWLKRRTPHNTVAGGVCGAAPVLIGWAAVTGSLGAEAWLLFAVVFLWQPPHFYALALRFRDDYARAGVPMLPVVASVRRVTVECVVYCWLTVAASVALWPVAMGPGYGVAAVLLGAVLLVEAHRLHHRAGRRSGSSPGSGRSTSRDRSKSGGAERGGTEGVRLFRWSTTYLTLLFAAVAVDVFWVW